MTDAAAAHHLLGSVSSARRQTRTARHAFWFPLVVFGLAIAGSLPFLVQGTPGEHDGTSGHVPGLLGGWGLNDAGRAVSAYWLIALPLGYFATAVYYRRRSQRTGVSMKVGGWAGAGVGLLLALALATTGLVGVLIPGDAVVRGIAPLLVIAVGLLALAYIDHSAPLGAIAVGFTAMALIADLYDVSNLVYRAGWSVPDSYSLWFSVIPPALLLLGSGAYFRPRQRRGR